MKRCTYLLPIRRNDFCADEARDFAAYFEILRAADCEVVVVDGSPPEIFEQHHQAWSALCNHQPVDRRHGYLNDKVNGIHTGVQLANCEKIILGDDDIRYSIANIEKMCTPRRVAHA